MLDQGRLTPVSGVSRLVSGPRRQSMCLTTSTLICKTDGPNATYLETDAHGLVLIHDVDRGDRTMGPATGLMNRRTLSSPQAVGPFIPTVVLEPEVTRPHGAQPGLSGRALDGQQLPFLDSASPGVIPRRRPDCGQETAYRTGDARQRVSLNAVAIEGLESDFPDHIQLRPRRRATAWMMRFNYNQEWDG